MDDTLKLITETITTDENDYITTTETQKEVFCEVTSVSRSEFFSAQKAGLSPSFTFRVAAVEYEGEKLIEYRGERYRIYRTYLRFDDTIELYAEYKDGVTDAGSGEGSNGSSEPDSGQGL